MVVDTPFAYNDMGHGPGGAVPGQVQFLGMVVDTPLRTTTWYVPDCTFLDKVVVLPVVFFMAGAVLGKVVDTAVVFNDRGHGPDSAVLDQVIDVPVAMQRHVPMVFEVVLTVQFLDMVIDVPVAVQRHVPMVVETVQFFDKVIDVLVLCTTGACGGRLLFLRQLHMGPDVHKTCGGAADAVLCGVVTPMWC